ncbi:hypothetical protein CPB84DRAFT_1842997 [Gymnopilus junonius]|uniref:CFEM domain-containing protein n=1 Tax=Gymnopilus junonius TaxID=109634 RepID=A0A9P5NYL8_GYMJU|nr:hypothetical protein CPB84DRAFT_1842997 [Gymnopilus junonius]
MRFSTVAFTLFGAAASVSASTLTARQTTLPDCAIPCTASADLGGCVVSDTHCLCTNQAFVSSTTTCMRRPAPAQTSKPLWLTLKAFASKSCGVTLTDSSTSAPSSTSASNNTASQTSSGASATSTSPSGSGSSPAPSNTASSASAHSVNAILGLAAAGLVAFAL